MIIGNGLLANAFSKTLLNNVCIYASGVSNSSCIDQAEFDREHIKIETTFKNLNKKDLFCYFSTCSILDLENSKNKYIQHKIKMESLIQERGNFLIFRLPQVVGKTSNPNTLLNYLYNKISNSEKFQIWDATRNIIDVRDISIIVNDIILNEKFTNEIINIANKKNYSMLEIVDTLAEVIGKKPIYEKIQKTSFYKIDISRLEKSLERCNVRFDDGYLFNLIKRYYFIR